MISLIPHDKALVIAALDRESAAINSALKLLFATGEDETSPAAVALIARGEDVSTLRLAVRLADTVCLSRSTDAG